MDSRNLTLREVMSETGTSQSRLSRLSGVHQPSISQFLSGKVGLSDELLDRLLSCMGFRLEVVRKPVKPDMTRSESLSWLLHREISNNLNRQNLDSWLPTITGNMDRLRDRLRGQPHRRNLERWQSLVEQSDISEMRRILTGLDRESIEMREVTPFSGVLSEDERSKVLQLSF